MPGAGASSRLAGRRAVITGGANGLGAATAELFAAEGASVALVDLPRAASAATSVVARIEASGGTAVSIEGDVLDVDSIRGAIDEAAHRLGGLDIAVASAGTAAAPGRPDAFRGLIDLDPEAFDFVQDVNLRGVFLTVQRVAQRMRKQGTGGSIVTLASIASKRATAGAYSISKAGVWMLTRCFAHELAGQGIRVNAIGPAYVPTDMIATIAHGAAGDDPAAQAAWIDDRRASIPMGVLPDAADIARTALFLCSDDGRMYTGAILHPDGGMVSATAGG